MIIIELKFFVNEHYIIIVINNKSDLNLISQNQIKEYFLNFIKVLNHNLIIVNSQKLFNYEIHHLKMKIFDQNDQIQFYQADFHAINLSHYDMILRLL